MNYNTIKGYLGGGNVRPMGYQTGGTYRRGVSQAKYNVGLNRDIRTAQEELRKEAERLEKKQKFGGYITTALDTVGKAMGVPDFISSGISTMAGDALAGTLSGVKDIKDSSSTGLLGGDFEYLSDINEGMTNPFDIVKRGFGAGAGTAVKGFGKDSLSNMFKNFKSTAMPEEGYAGFKLNTPSSDEYSILKEKGLKEKGLDFKPLRNRGLDFSASNQEVLRPTLSENIPKDIKLSGEASDVLTSHKLSNAPTISGNRVNLEIAKTYDEAAKQYETASRDWQKVIDIHGGDTEVAYKATLPRANEIGQSAKTWSGDALVPPAVETQPLGNVLDDSGVFPKGPSFLGQSSVSGLGQAPRLTSSSLMDTSKALKGSLISQVPTSLSQDIGESFDFSGISEEIINKYKNELAGGGINWERNLQEAIDAGVVTRGAQHGGQVGVYSGGKGLLSMMPFSRRIV